VNLKGQCTKVCYS